MLTDLMRTVDLMHFGHVCTEALEPIYSYTVAFVEDFQMSSGMAGGVGYPDNRNPDKQSRSKSRLHSSPVDTLLCIASSKWKQVQTDLLAEACCSGARYTKRHWQWSWIPQRKTQSNRCDWGCMKSRQGWRWQWGCRNQEKRSSGIPAVGVHEVQGSSSSPSGTGWQLQEQWSCHTENWECWGYSSSKWLSEKMES